MLISLAESGVFPTPVLACGIRSLLRRRLRQEQSDRCDLAWERKKDFISRLRQSPLAVLPEKANEQHYEVPAAFYNLVLGARKKYSSCYYHPGVRDLDRAEEDMLAITCARADLADGMQILELGCGWGSLTLWMAEKYPQAKITAVSNSHSQREYIEARCAARGFANVRIITCDMNDFSITQQFDRVVSVEMFEHMRNYELLFQRIAGWLAPQGKLFAHIFCHREFAYLFEVRGAADWMSEYFFSGGIMPSDDLFYHFSRDLLVKNHWRVNGTHYAQTSLAWMHNLENRRDEALRVLGTIYGVANQQQWFMRWKLFFLACAELFGFQDGNEWWVSHYLFEKR